MTDRKRVQRVEVKDEDRGEVRAVIATLGVKDKDGDVIRPGAFGRQDVLVSAFNHRSWEGQLPVGKGVVVESGDRAIADVQFLMSTDHGRAHFETVKALGDAGRWSFGFTVAAESPPTPEQRERGVRRVLDKLSVDEVSPVMKGAGIGTRTLSAKCSRCGAGGAAVSPDPELVEDARRTVRKASHTLEGEPPGTVLTHPDRGVQDLGRFAVAVAWRVAGWPGLPWRKRAPGLRWYVPSDRTSAFMVPGEHKIHVSLHQRGKALCRSILHEARHFAQPDPRDNDAEEDAHGFARRWAPAVKTAHRATGGDASAVHVEDGRPPWYGRKFRPGDVVLSRSTSKAWQYHPSNTGSPWTGLAT